ncbi:exopolygalacturonase-like [Cucumis melo var. makuwa]|uniref:Exopolygalacturonase-like n=1 Tax=Cucumis melo var. makuwa TaxID=1194695 RepID=A0A5A7UVN2_CUCMM|nr:exopolygalacturonase-like [Cucumis melo var. makuwa]TYK02529.1 exopolygalacturonase-like [Cucumis melo var. makuwa]
MARHSHFLSFASFPLPLPLPLPVKLNKKEELDAARVEARDFRGLAAWVEGESTRAACTFGSSYSGDAQTRMRDSRRTDRQADDEDGSTTVATWQATRQNGRRLTKKQLDREEDRLDKRCGKDDRG